MKVWKIGERFTIPEKEGEGEKTGSVVGVSPRTLIVRLDDETEVDVSIDEFGIPNFGDELGEIQGLLNQLGRAADVKKEKKEVCLCHACQMRIRIATEFAGRMVDKMATVETHPDPESVARIAYNYADHLLYHHAENPPPKHGRE